MISKCVDEVTARVSKLYTADNQSVAHRMDHVGRVLANARAIAVHFPEADEEILTLAVLFHDVTSPYNQKKQHVRLSMNTARRILNGIRYPQDRAERVIAIIAEHSTENPKEGALSSVEARILFDADKIDGIGANGIARAFALKGQQGRDPISAVVWYRKKIRTAVSHMQTEPGREMMAERLLYVEEFLQKFDEENAESHTMSEPGPR